MDQHRFASELKDFCKARAAAAAELESRCAGIAARQAQCDGRMAERLARVAALQLDLQVDFDDRVRAELAARAADEQRERGRLLEINAGLDAELSSQELVRQEFNAVRAQADALLRADPEFARRSLACEQALAAQAAFKPDLEELSGECSGKLAAFQTGRLYDYLRRRGYGGGSYAAPALARALDGWIARLCHFDVNHRTEQTLLSMQAELARRAASLGVAVARCERDAQMLADAAAEKAGLPSVDARLDARKEAARRLRADAARVQDTLDAYASKTDARYRSAQAMVVDYLKAQSIEQLVAQTKKTQGADEALAGEIGELARQRAAVRAEYEEASGRYLQAKLALARADELSDGLRRTLPGRHSVVEHSFGRKLDLQALMADHASGALSADAAHVLVERHRKVRFMGSYTSGSGTGAGIGIVSGAGSGAWAEQPGDASSSPTSGADSFSSSDSSGGGGYSSSDNF
ncbi:hypothetical protein LJR289_004488 [Pseudoduganella sp. LjRoot289]|uniref:hypothetical protein n=1 Tax=Pseudoduganella sp. LjRoot289 TaxID=3342314 RepID=UPI003ECDC425